MIWVAQWTCPQNHAAFATAYDDAVRTRAEVDAWGESIFAEVGLRRRCGICDGPVAAEHERSPFPTLEETVAAMVVSQQAQMESRAILDALGQTHDERRRRRIERSN